MSCASPRDCLTLDGAWLHGALAQCTVSRTPLARREPIVTQYQTHLRHSRSSSFSEATFLAEPRRSRLFADARLRGSISASTQGSARGPRKPNSRRQTKASFMYPLPHTSNRGDALANLARRGLPHEVEERAFAPNFQPLRWNSSSIREPKVASRCVGLGVLGNSLVGARDATTPAYSEVLAGNAVGRERWRKSASGITPRARDASTASAYAKSARWERSWRTIVPGPSVRRERRRP